MPLSDTPDTREAMIAACLWMNAQGINQGTSGNISVRVADGILITPSAMPYEDLTSAKIVKIAPEGPPDPALPYAPSSEWQFHQALHAARPDMPVVLHAHPPYCSALAAQRRGIPACHYMVAAFGGDDVPLADYALFGSDALAEGLSRTLEKRHGCLMANHGATVLGETIERAKWRLMELESLAHTYLLSQIGGAPHILSKAEMAQVHEGFANYSSKPKKPNG